MTKHKSSNILINKASGEQELFDVAKLRNSLSRAGADDFVVKEITENIQEWLYEGVSTKKIYERAFSLLRRQSQRNATLYKLKRSLFELGPSGYPFEHLIGEIYRRRGFSVEVGVVVQGHCITHEMDVIATDSREQILLECKYGIDQGKIISIQVPLYVRSRIEDIIAERKQFSQYKDLTFNGGVVTNTRFSNDAIEYSKCYGLSLLGWDYPNGNGLKEILECERIFPVTILSSLTAKQKSFIMDQGIVTCLQLHNDLKVLESMTIPPNKMKSIQEELEAILEI